MNDVAQHIRNIGVYAISDDTNQVPFESAAELGEQLDAHVTGIFAVPHAPSELTQFADTEIGVDLVDQYEANMQKIAIAHQQQFMDAMRETNVFSSWKVEHGHTTAVVAETFRCNDLGVVRRPVTGDSTGYRNVVNEIILTTGRPILLIPPIGTPSTVGTKVVVAWNGSRESTRALHDALPLLQQAHSVEIVSVESGTEHGRLGESVPAAEHLSRHGVNVTATKLLKEGQSVANRLLQHAEQSHADLIVAGAWGHARIKEYITGGVTRELLEKAPIPVLFSH